MQRSGLKVRIALARCAIAILLVTFPVSCSLGGHQVPVALGVARPAGDAGCGSWETGEPVRGTLTFDVQDDLAETWIVNDAGERLFVLWPSGFSATDDGGMTLLDDRGSPIFAEGEVVELPQVDARLHAGTVEDPYVAAGIFAGQCWVPPPDQFEGNALHHL